METRIGRFPGNFERPRSRTAKMAQKTTPLTKGRLGDISACSFSHRCKNVFYVFYTSLKNMYFVLTVLMFLCMFLKMFFIKV